MMYMLPDGWREESTEGPYTEVLQTKYVDGVVFTIIKIFGNLKYVVKVDSRPLDITFYTLHEAKQAAENYIKNLKESKNVRNEIFNN